MDGSSEDVSQITAALPIALGPCMLFKRNTKRPSNYCPTGQWLRSLVVKGNQNSGDQSGDSRGQWTDGFIILYSDSTMTLRDCSGDKNQIIASFNLIDVYREIQFGEDVLSLPELPPSPPNGNNSSCSLLGIPGDMHCNSQLTWLFFYSQNTLKKWLVAICKSLPAKKLHETKCNFGQQQTQHNVHSSPIPEEHIRLFFPHGHEKLVEPQSQKHENKTKQGKEDASHLRENQPQENIPPKRAKKAPRIFGRSKKLKSEKAPNATAV